MERASSVLSSLSSNPKLCYPPSKFRQFGPMCPSVEYERMILRYLTASNRDGQNQIEIRRYNCKLPCRT